MEGNNTFYLVTGAASGLGRGIAEVLASGGATVFAADIRTDALEAGDQERLIPVQIDVTETESVKAAVKAISKMTDGLDGIINAAGIFRTGAMVEADEKDFIDIFMVNVSGMYRVNREFFDLLYKRKGRVVNISSETARYSAGFNGLYSMSKYAVEAYSDSLRMELSLLGMKVIIIQPGPVKTPLLDANQATFRAVAAKSRYFRPQLEKIAELVVGEDKKAVRPETVARVVEKVLKARRPGTRYRVNNDPLRAFVSYLPASWADAIMRLALK